MVEEKVQQANPQDPTINVKNIVEEAVSRIDDLRVAEVRRIDERIDANDDKYQIQFADSEKAVISALIATKENGNKADQTNEKRFDAVNESYSKLSEQQTKLLTRNEYDSAHKSLAEKIDGVESRINRTEGQSGVFVTHTDLSSSLEKLQGNIEVMIRPIVTNQDVLNTFMNSQRGKEGVTDPAMTKLTKAVEDLVGTKSQGISASWGVLVGAVGFIATLIAIFFALSK